MSILSVMISRKLLLISFTLILLAVYFNDKIHPLYNSTIEKLQKLTEKKLYTDKDLAEFDGVTKEALYLAILGSIYDVTKGRKNYDKGASYHYFVGKDGSRSFITGKFGGEQNNGDHVLDLTCGELFNLKNWRDTLKSRYEYKGKHIGRYYDENGEATPYMKELKAKLKQCKIEEKQIGKQKKRFPPCNIEWTAKEGSKVWCTKDSGGISRNWVGVPRQLYTPGEDQPQCACIDMGQDLSGTLLKAYEGCPATSISCVVPNSK